MRTCIRTPGWAVGAAYWGMAAVAGMAFGCCGCAAAGGWPGATKRCCGAGCMPCCGYSGAPIDAGAAVAGRDCKVVRVQYQGRGEGYK